MSNQKKESKWDLGKSQSELLGFLVQKKSLSYLDFRRNRDVDSAENYLNTLAATFVDIRKYDPQNDVCEEIQDKIDSAEKKLDQARDFGEFDAKSFEQELLEINQMVDELRLDIGLDLPFKTNKEEGMEMLS